MLRLRHYVDTSGRDRFGEWLDSLRDQRATARIAARLNRLELGLFGDTKPVGDGVFELRLDYGPGYRIYFSRVSRMVVLLLCGGDKDSQANDIAVARIRWKEWQRRNPG